MKGEQNLFDIIKFDKNGLIPAVVQDHESGEVLMLAFMNEESLRITLDEGFACYFSRSRNKLWKKGETSGQTQEIKKIMIDCDGDTLILKVKQEGVACHTGRRSCFFWDVELKGTTEKRGQEYKVKINQDILIPEEELYKKG